MSDNGASSYRRFLRGEKTALEEMICTYSDDLVRFAYGYVKCAAAAEDVAADVFAALFMKGKRFDEEAKMRAYLYRMTRSRCIDYLRRHRRDTPLEDVENVLYCSSAEADFLRRYRDEKLYVCMQALPGQYREVLQLTYFSGFSLEDSGRIIGKNRKQMYNLHSRAKIALKNLLEKEGITREDL